MQHNETQGNIMQHNETQRNIMQHNETQCNIMQHNETLCNKVVKWSQHFNTTKRCMTLLQLFDQGLIDFSYNDIKCGFEILHEI